ncbi:AbrB family transcriptional regulator [Falsibacillus albus]|uniref:AbrB family transcriptional regulator n=1 Tax=Falsibacillus albus TaxID=2478915 RepID=A0A3L7JTS0_9BACI|nr:AbrB family transcriptional regulator [Falsibacillus albus]RLQ93675.1 AbrB family transcriptional regulator [Falsibacillus albus]
MKFSKNRLLQNICFLIISSFGGYLLSLTGTSIAWMVGSLAAAGILSFWKPRWLQLKKGIEPYWRHIGQAIIGIELGQQISISVFKTFEMHYVVITATLLLSILLALVSGVVLWWFSKADMVTSLFSTTPGGISAMPSIAEEVGANTVTVSIVQMIRIFLVVGTVPLLANSSKMSVASGSMAAPIMHILHPDQVTWTFALILGSTIGYIIGRLVKLPAPWLVGGMMAVAVIQLIGTSTQGGAPLVWWPHGLNVLAQIFIGASIGSRLNKEMFTGAKKIFVFGLLTSSGLIAAMALFALEVSKITHIPFATALLAFAPGGVAEMATTSIALHADSTFVVTVQVLRLLTIFMILPPLFKLLNKQGKGVRPPVVH